MSFKRFAAAGLAAVLAGWTSTATAAGEYGRSGPYLAGGGVYAIEDVDAPAGITDVGNSWGYDLRAGYRFNRWFALEAEWEQWLEFDTDPAFHIDGWFLGANGRGYFSEGPIQPFVTGGIGYMSVDGGTSEEGIGMRVGAGADFYMNRNWAVTTEVGYVIGTGDVSDFNAIPISLGVLYRFY